MTNQTPCYGQTDVFVFCAPQKRHQLAARIAKARAICATCDIADACLRYRLNHPELESSGTHEDIVAGTTRTERAAMRGDDVYRQCGTTNGYRVHYKRHEEACPACKTAWWDYMRPIKQAARKQIDHGTRNGYIMHIKRDEEACADCKAANVEYVLRRRNARTGQAA